MANTSLRLDICGDVVDADYERLVLIDLPWPPSVNHYWKARGKRRFISARANAWMKEAVFLVQQARRSLSFTGPVAVVAFLHPPDRRVRDIDNTAKPLLDALVKGGLIKSDHQVSLLLLKREEVLRGGRARVIVLG